MSGRQTTRAVLIAIVTMSLVGLGQGVYYRVERPLSFCDAAELCKGLGGGLPVKSDLAAVQRFMAGDPDVYTSAWMVEDKAAVSGALDYCRTTQTTACPGLVALPGAVDVLKPPLADCNHSSVDITVCGPPDNTRADPFRMTETWMSTSSPIGSYCHAAATCNEQNLEIPTISFLAKRVVQRVLDNFEKSGTWILSRDASSGWRSFCSARPDPPDCPGEILLHEPTQVVFGAIVGCDVTLSVVCDVPDKSSTPVPPIEPARPSVTSCTTITNARPPTDSFVIGGDGQEGSDDGEDNSGGSQEGGDDGEDNSGGSQGGGDDGEDNGGGSQGGGDDGEDNGSGSQGGGDDGEDNGGGSQGGGDNGEDNGGDNLALILGVVAGVLVLVVIGIIVFFILTRKKRPRKSTSDPQYKTHIMGARNPGYDVEDHGIISGPTDHEYADIGDVTDPPGVRPGQTPVTAPPPIGADPGYSEISEHEGDKGVYCGTYEDIDAVKMDINSKQSPNGSPVLTAHITANGDNHYLTLLPGSDYEGSPHTELSPDNEPSSLGVSGVRNDLDGANIPDNVTDSPDHMNNSPNHVDIQPETPVYAQPVKSAPSDDVDTDEVTLVENSVYE